MSTAPDVRHNEAEHRYEIALDGKLAVAEYEFADGKQVFTHTVVPPEFRGRGFAEALVRTALNDAKAAGRKIVPACSYVAIFVQRNREFAGLVDG
jgi:hypothetical protein